MHIRNANTTQNATLLHTSSSEIALDGDEESRLGLIWLIDVAWLWSVGLGKDGNGWGFSLYRITEYQIENFQSTLCLCVLCQL